MTWIVELSGDQHALRELEEGFRGETPVLVVDGKYQLDPALFAQTDDYQAVKVIAGREVDYLNGYIRLFLAGGRKITVGNISRESPDEPKVHYVSMRDGLAISARLVGFTLGDDEAVIREPERGPGLQAWRALVQGDPVVADVLAYLKGALDDWTNLTRIIEAVEHDVGRQDDLIATGWVDGQSLKAFYATANNPLVAGVTARHGARKFQIPKSTMDIHEARQLVLKVAGKWIGAKIAAPAGGE
ncbi:hypothetical protein E2F46_06620 [Luteimonas aestuarii]|jgi:hypothetical protein|uniref:Uncharacterized protein n=1 Tax=Luteimonas aestuarii TaxID=453837 RepID=A0A4R5TYI0_9GAMM|nr:hypothetical protein [Luteimonas aestuarii]TDK26263.1 hypothetical protein E2F46_06620 [Luteimonas aestuarii]